jgi:hypothetical protein
MLVAFSGWGLVVNDDVKLTGAQKQNLSVLDQTSNDFYTLRNGHQNSN